MPIKGLKSNVVSASVELLNACVADAIALSLALKQAHWTVKGPNFIAVHELLDQVWARTGDSIDVMAEQVATLGGQTMGTLEAVAKAAEMKAYPADLVKVDEQVKAICDRMADLGAKVRKAIAATSDAGDETTTDIFVNVARQLDKDLWFLESHIREH